MCAVIGPTFVVSVCLGFRESRSNFRRITAKHTSFWQKKKGVVNVAILIAGQFSLLNLLNCSRAGPVG